MASPDNKTAFIILINYFVSSHCNVKLFFFLKGGGGLLFVNAIAHYECFLSLVASINLKGRMQSD